MKNVDGYVSGYKEGETMEEALIKDNDFDSLKTVLDEQYENYWESSIVSDDFSKWVVGCVGVGVSNTTKSYIELAKRAQDEKTRCLVIDSLADLPVESSEEYETPCTFNMIQKIIEAYADDFKNELDDLVLENYNANEDLARKVGYPQEWKHKQKKRPWS